MTDWPRIHYSDKRFAWDQAFMHSPRIVSRRLADDSLELKPIGLWYSVVGDDDWASWCIAEEFRLDHLAERLALTIDLDRMRVIRDVVEFDAFADEFRLSNWDDSAPASDSRIHWGKVEAEYAGLEIAPYLWDRRMEPKSFWYYGWDCASGCVWNLDAVLSQNWIEHEPATQETADGEK